MPTYVFITIDTEEDQWGDYGSSSYSTENIKRLPELQKLFARYGAVPTYLINYPVAASEQATNILRDIHSRGACEIGTHCHPWNTPPYDEERNVRNSMMCNLDEALLYRKMAHLHETIGHRIGRSPSCFRAGRWGFSESVARCIHRLGYKVDTSISPFMNWTPDEGPDYGKATTRAYRFDPDEPYEIKADGKLLEVPATVGFYQRNFGLCNRLMRWISKHTPKRLHILGILSRLRLLNFGWLSPELNTGNGMVLLSKNFLKTGHAFLNMSFHSTSLLPGMSPFVRKEEDYERFLRDIEIFLKFATDHNMVFVPLSASADLNIASQAVST